MSSWQIQQLYLSLMSDCWSSILLPSVFLCDNVLLGNPALMLLPALLQLERKRLNEPLLLSHLCEISLLRTSLCLLNAPCWLKHLLHCLHSYRFSPLWTLSWILRLAIRVKHLPQFSHSWGFSPVWTLSCILRVLECLKHLPHRLHS